MPTVGWYVRRLRAMSAAEALLRVGDALRDGLDRLRLSTDRAADLAERLVRSGATGDGERPAGRLARPGAWASAATGSREQRWLARLVERAERAARNRVELFDLRDAHLGDPIDWNCDIKTGRRTPLSFAPGIDYRDFDAVGDCKFVWEPNRHQHLVILARAYRATGAPRFAQAAAAQLESWLDQCPFGRGMNWRSPLELAVRLINWVWTLDLLGDSGAVAGPLRSRIERAAALHLWEIARKLSRGSSANNHRVGEAAGLWIGANRFRSVRGADRYLRLGRDVLCDEILRQTYADGGTREQALGYLGFVTQFFFLSGLAACGGPPLDAADRSVGECAARGGADVPEPRGDRGAFPPEYWERLARMFEFIAALGAGGGSPPMFGDCDDGYVLDLDGDPRDLRPWLGAAALIFGRADWTVGIEDCPEAAYWLFGGEAGERWRRLADRTAAGGRTPEGASGAPRRTARPVSAGDRLESRAFPHSGYYLLQTGHVGKRDAISVLFDCGPLGLGALAAHGHADALSFTLRAFGVDVLVDPGTYDYFSYPAWRAYFRSTRAHNALTIDGADQSQMLGPFLWGRRAEARCTCWEPSADGGRVAGEHDGYRFLPGRPIHRRALGLTGAQRRLTVRDEVRAGGAHELAVFFHFAETCRLAQRDGHAFVFDVGPGRATLSLDPRLEASVLVASTEPIGGWVSRGYHRKSPSVTIVGRCRTVGNVELVCDLLLEDAERVDGPRARRACAGVAPADPTVERSTTDAP